MPTKASQRQARYDKSHTTGIYLKLNNTTDADVIAQLQKVDNRQGYIKRLIRADIGKSE